MSKKKPETPFSSGISLFFFQEVKRHFAKETFNGILVFLSLLCAFELAAQAPPSKPWVEVMVSPNHADWAYKLGEEVEFNVHVLHNNEPLEGLTIHYTLGPERMPPVLQNDVLISKGGVKVLGGTLNTPGFLRCTVQVEYQGKTYTGWATAAFEPEAIVPFVKEPKDFDSFWAEALAENKALPLDTKMILLPERCTDKVNVYEVSLQNWKPGARLYGILCVPKEPGKYPAVLKVPGAGIRPYAGDVAFAEDGIISLEIGIHGISVTMPQKNYDDLLAKWHNQYWNVNNNDRDRYYYKRVFMGCIRANDFLCALPQWDGKNLGVMGSSQGGALSFVTAALDKRVTAAAPIHPAMCDMPAYLEGRAGGWPHFLQSEKEWEKASHADVLSTLAYYDVVNFAKRIKVPVWLSFGFNDTTCPPTSVYAAYNSLKTQKELFLAIESSHWVFPEQLQAQRDWVSKQLKK
ncbi:acetylxylan esterase [Marinilongibacter aquaticus]|uniref:acetylxylan esterase n=1 Tax=Marinilongibacter aquaticus TaxID=2975157 RepID=UPI0021BD97FE|nr:acetylxylan esterase [Marinilongibacter aquaticus]UBM60887.1 acetylxylan esterase [Marinilongibacter aquaticus]